MPFRNIFFSSQLFFYQGENVCKEIKNIDTGYVEYSAYHRMDKLVDNDDEEDDEEETETKREVLLLQ